MEIREIAKGYYVTSEGEVIQAAMVDKELADKLLSDAAKSQGIDEGKQLKYPHEDGRSSIPKYELGQKGYLKLQPKELFAEFQRITKMVPDYLRERGIIPPKKIETISDKVEKEYKAYTKEISKLKKTDIIAHAEEIAEMKKIKDFMQQPHNNMKNFGVLLQNNNILETLHKQLKADQVMHGTVNSKTIGRQIGLLSSGSALAASENYMEQFKNEIKVAKKPKVQSLELAVAVPGKDTQRINMSVNDFYNHIDKAVLDRFSAAEMHDFPTPDYYGEKYKKLYEQIREKRFCENLERNFNNYTYPESDHYIMISGVSKQPYQQQSDLQEIQNRMVLKEYASGYYEKPEPTVKQIDSYIGKQKSILDDISRIVAPVAAAAVTVKAVEQVAEKVVDKAAEKIINHKADVPANVPVVKAEPTKTKENTATKEIISNMVVSSKNAEEHNKPTADNITLNIQSQLNMVSGIGR